MPDDASETKFPVPFGKYLLTELIAVGGMAEVYKGKVFGASGFEKEMVVKRILPRYAKNPSFVQMLIDEAKIAVNLTHGNIVPIYELGEFEGSYYIAMEYVEGQTILDVLRTAHARRRRLPWPYALGVCADVAAGLAYAHSRARPDGTPLGLVHRDINPRNIVITKDGEVKILDFGIARASTKKHQTASGVIKGTPGYMSPEQMNGQSVDARSDIYCLGILTHELLTLRRLFPAWTVKEMRQLFEEKRVQPPSQLVPELPPSVDQVVMKALSTDPATRYSDAGELEEALRGAIAQSGVAVTARGLAREIKSLEAPEAPGSILPSPPQDLPQASTGPDAPTTSEKLVPLSNGPVLAPPGTQPMPPQPSAQPSGADEHAFVISLASDPTEPSTGEKRRLSQLEPLPPTRAIPTSDEAPRTQVLAKNDALAWSSQIGDDAEVLAIARATGVAPGQTRNKLLVALGVLALLLVPTGAFYAPDVIDMVSRALEGRVLRPGALVVKTKPSGAEVILDGKSRGKTNLRMTGVDPDANHQLTILLDGKDPIQVEFGPADFQPVDGLPTYSFDRDFIGAGAEGSPAGDGDEAAEPGPEDKAKDKPGKKGRRRGKKR